MKKLSPEEAFKQLYMTGWTALSVPVIVIILNFFCSRTIVLGATIGGVLAIAYTYKKILKEYFKKTFVRIDENLATYNILLFILTLIIGGFAALLWPWMLSKYFVGTKKQHEKLKKQGKICFITFISVLVIVALVFMFFIFCYILLSLFG